MQLPALSLIEWIYPLAINFLLILLVHRIPLLTPSGWIHAGALGTILWSCLGLNGWLAVVFYLFLGSAVTRVGYHYKFKLGLAEKRGGRRGPENLWGSAATGTVLAMLIKLNVGDPILLKIAFAASFSAKLADTFGSEIGQLWGRPAYLISTLKRVSPGTDGAISIQGTIASFIGSLSMATIMINLGFLDSIACLLLVAFVGLIATLMESFVGAIAQNRYSWLSNEFVNFLQTTFAAIVSLLLSRWL